MSALLALADAATTMLSDEESGDVAAAPPSDDASSMSHESGPSDVGPAMLPCPRKVGNDRRPAKKRHVPPEAQIQALPNINSRAHQHLPGMMKPLAVPQARPNNFYARAQHSALYQPAQLPAQLRDECAPPMPLSMLPKKKRKKKEERYTDLQGKFLATSWYFNESTFPVTLMAIIESQGNHSPCITFLSDNQRFVVVDPSTLEKDIFPKHFDLRTPTLEDFSEMLDLWGFEKSVDKLFPNVDVYKHEQFLKGDWEKCLKIEMPPGSLEKLTKIQGQAVKADAARKPPSKQSPRKRSRRGNGVPLPPAELLAGFSPGSDKAPKLAPSADSIPRRITQETVPPLGLSYLGNGAANAQSLLLSQLQQNQVLQSMLLGQPSNPQGQQQNLVNRNTSVGRRISIDTNPLIQRFQYPRPSPAIASETNNVVNQSNKLDLDPPVFSRRISDDLKSLKGKLSSKELDTMTEQFLARSNARLKSRPAGIRGPSPLPRRPIRSNSVPTRSTIGVQQTDRLANLQLQSMISARQRLGNTRRITML